MDKLQIVHAADMHLGSPFRCGSSEISARRRREQMGTLENLMLFIAEKNIPLVLLPGDLFDGMVTVELSREFFAKVRRMRDVKFVIAPGNHDYYTEGGMYDEHADLPENLFVFRSTDVTKFEFPELGADVYGFAFTSPTMYTSPSFAGIKLDPERINLLCVHGSLDDPLSPYCPLSSAEIAEKGFDYVALGHIHTGDHRLVGNTSFAYCGCLEGRDFGETGSKGFYRVIIERGRPVSVMFRRLSRRNYEIVTSDVTSADSDERAMELIRASLADFPPQRQENTFLRLVLTGSVPPGYTPNLQVIRNGLLRGFYYSELQDRTVPVFSADALESDKTVRGAFYRALKPGLLSADPAERENAAYAFRLGMKAINGEELE
ncbi:MAG: metallophosphoesterase [Clostridia bacterium]|nr:metallophosphoesterase [Clostridia bacterium]